MKNIYIPITLAVAAVFALSCSHHRQCTTDTREIRTGAEQLVAHYIDRIGDRRVGLVINQTARIGDAHLLDILLSLNVNVTALFAPEHGFRGESGAGEKIEDGIDQATGLPVFTLYNKRRKPTPEMLDRVDILIFDIQDVGARFYTYIATLGRVIEVAADAGVPVWILDRPNPAGGDYVSGWMLEEEFTSFVGPYPIPIAHGLTIGEIAKMMVGEGWISCERNPEIVVVKMEGWRREMKWPDTGLDWVPPSPNLPSFDHAYMYLGTVFFEGTTLSEGRGTDNPFLTIGDPSTQISAETLHQLQNLSESLRIEPITFTPVSMPGVAPSPKHEGTTITGIRIHLLDYDFDPVVAGLKIFSIILNATADYETRDFLYKLSGTRAIDHIIDGEVRPAELNFNLESFLERRKEYLLY